MTLFFDLKKLEDEGKGNSVKYISALKYYYYKPYLSKNLHGKSFILNPDPLFDKSVKADPAYIVQYIKLAGMRDYFLYKEYDVRSLPLSYYPDINYSAVKYNPLLTITTTEIYFLYEEQFKRK